MHSCRELQPLKPPLTEAGALSTMTASLNELRREFTSAARCSSARLPTLKGIVAGWRCASQTPLHLTKRRFFLPPVIDSWGRQVLLLETDVRVHAVARLVSLREI